MLESAVSEFLDQLGTEREFDVPFLAMLRSQGFYDIQFTHGRYEFGKDFIAKREDEGETVQYLFQSKLGDVGTTVWRQELQPQCEEMLTVTIGHPNIDVNLSKQAVAVFTGRFKGQAAVTAQGYRDSLARRNLPDLSFWSRENLLEYLTAETCLGGYSDWATLGNLLSRCSSGETGLSELEVFSREWLGDGSNNIWLSTLEYSLMRDHLIRRQLYLHAIRLFYGLVRAVVAQQEHGLDSGDTELMFALLKQELSHLARPVVQWWTGVSPEMRKYAVCDLSCLEVVTAGSRLLYMAEVLALSTLCNGLWTADERAVIGEFLNYLLGLPTVSRPISDDFAPTVLVVALASHELGITGIEPWLEAVVDWIRTAYDDDGLGLSAVRASATDLMWRSIGASVEYHGIEKSSHSVLAAAILDSCSLLGFRSLYDAAVREFDAADVVPLRMVPVRSPEELQVGIAEGCVSSSFSDYSKTWRGEDGWMNARLHSEYAPRRFDELGHHWVGCALSLLLRDRWWLHSMRAYGVVSEAS
ncbi:MAG: hypothetical protein AB7S38_33725 [Vulcanimicrobiota bacterium]